MPDLKVFKTGVKISVSQSVRYSKKIFERFQNTGQRKYLNKISVEGGGGIYSLTLPGCSV